jgi:hypothetical protein
MSLAQLQPGPDRAITQAVVKSSIHLPIDAILGGTVVFLGGQRCVASLCCRRMLR